MKLTGNHKKQIENAKEEAGSLKAETKLTEETLELVRGGIGGSDKTGFAPHHEDDDEDNPGPHWQL
jgi:hypothetical protein